MRDGSEGRCGFSWNTGDNMAKQRIGTHLIGVEKIMTQTKTPGPLEHPFGIAHNTRAFLPFTICYRARHFSMTVLHRRTEFGLVSEVGSILYYYYPTRFISCLMCEYEEIKTGKKPRYDRNDEWVERDIATELTALHSPARDVTNTWCHARLSGEAGPKRNLTCPLCTTVVTNLEHYDNWESLTDDISWRTCVTEWGDTNGTENLLSTLKRTTSASDVIDWPLVIMAGKSSRCKSAYKAFYYYWPYLVTYCISLVSTYTEAKLGWSAISRKQLKIE